jgi:MoxR-like ATPase
MTGWRLPLEPEDHPPPRWVDLPPPLMAEMTGPEHYIAHEALMDAINTALALGQPLLVTGEPGCGKTELGDFVAWQLGLGRAIRYQIKSDMQSRDLFYSFDTVARFHEAQMAGREASARRDAVHFIEYHGLGEAIIRATAPGANAHLLSERLRREHTQQRRSVVLIDEIDKAPRDVPNDLLAEFERPRFRIPELSNSEIAADERFRPILVVTSNSEKALPDAFLRRCVYYDMPFPDPSTLKRIVEARIARLRGAGGSALVDDAIALTDHLRRNRTLRKKPGTAEVLNFVLTLLDRGYEPARRLRDTGGWLTLARITLLKARDDQEPQRAASHFENVPWKSVAGR